ncbi:MAG TPA: hypothetical protein VN843_18705 [Anaerolineales bacterium]|nr:hypothetical protein [Anaerolineales bacterium]
MTAILLIDDDKDTWEAVRLALEPSVKVHVIDSLAGALGFLRTRSHEVCGVIVDLNLTEYSDNFGREILERLRDMAMPCVVFSSSITSPADALRYENEFGVLGTIGKGSADASGSSSLQQLRESVDRMIGVSTEQLRSRICNEIEQELKRRDVEIDRERVRADELVAETRKITGEASAVKLATIEKARIDSLVVNAKIVRDEVMGEVKRAGTIEDLERARAEIMRTLGVL